MYLERYCLSCKLVIHDAGNQGILLKHIHKQKRCLIGIYHSLTLNTDERIAKKSLRKEELLELCSMGVNFPNIRRVIMYGPPRTILDFHQGEGCAGRDGLPAEVLLYYHGQQSTHCQTYIKQFLNNAGQGCVQVAAYQSLVENICPLSTHA